jgi:hypothetical protein
MLIIGVFFVVNDGAFINFVTHKLWDVCYAIRL